MPLCPFSKAYCSQPMILTIYLPNFDIWCSKSIQLVYNNDILTTPEDLLKLIYDFFTIF